MTIEERKQRILDKIAKIRAEGGGMAEAMRTLEGYNQ